MGSDEPLWRPQLRSDIQGDECADGGELANEPAHGFAITVPATRGERGDAECPADSPDASYGGTAETGESSSDTGAAADLPMGNCSVDEHDPNGRRADARWIGQNEELSATLCAGGDETDWYTFTLAVPSYVGVEVLFEKDGQDVALELSEHDSGALIERSEGGADMQATHQLLQPGTYDIEVQRVLGDPSYTLHTYSLPTNTPPSTNMRSATRVFCPRFDLDGQYEFRSSSADMREDFGLEDSPDRWRPESMLVRVLDGQANVRLGMDPSINYDWCSVTSRRGSTHTADSPEWQSAAMVEGFADFYATAVFNELGAGAWFRQEDIENDTKRYFAQCQASLNSLMVAGHCGLQGDATLCSHAGGSNETDWAGTLWDFAKVVGVEQLPAVLLLLSDAFRRAWDPGSTTINAYGNMWQAASLRFPNNGNDFDAAARANGANR